MKYKISLAVALIFISIFISNVQAQGTGYELLWSYEAGDGVTSISMSSDGSYVAAGFGWTSKVRFNTSFGENRVYLFDRTGNILWDYKTEGTVSSVSLSSDGSYVAVGSLDNVYLFDPSGNLLWSYKTDSYVGHVSISPDGSHVAAQVGYDVYLFDRLGNLLWSYKTDNWVRSVSISSDGSYIAAGSGDKKVYFFDRSGNLLWSYNTGENVNIVSVSSDGSYIAAGIQDSTWNNIDDYKVSLFDRSGNLLWNYNTDSYVNGVSISSDGSYIGAGSWGGREIYFFDRSGKLIWNYNPGEDVNGVSITPDGSYVVAGVSGRGYLDDVYIFDRSGNLIWSYDTPSGGVSNVLISSDGFYVAAESMDDNNVYFFGRKDETSPTISITSPYNEQPFTTNTISINGTASDNVGISKVEVKIGSGSWQIASGTTSWSKQITLSSGSNTIYARATDTSGNAARTSVTVVSSVPTSDMDGSPDVVPQETLPPVEGQVSPGGDVESREDALTRKLEEQQKEIEELQKQVEEQEKNKAVCGPSVLLLLVVSSVCLRAILRKRKES